MHKAAVEDWLDDFFAARPHLAPARANLAAAYQAISETLAAQGILYLAGNGGSFADAVHIKGELAKSFERQRPITHPDIRAALAAAPEGSRLLANLERGLPVVVLGESHSLRSAYENDRDAELAYAQELHAFAERLPRGCLLGISTSGNARNVVAAAVLARACGLRTIGFTGPGGGRLAEVCEVAWRVPGGSTAEVQENQLPLYHQLCRMLEARFFAAK